MSKKPFHFKEFSVLQDQCAMKVGTDGVLLGSWVEIADETDSILDIGTGTGLLALQMAQRSEAEMIDAVEIEDKAFEQAVDNFENSPWSDRLFCYHASIEEFKEEIDEQYDLIISNPPYFNDTFKDLNHERALARHTQQLSFTSLLSSTENLLSPKGSCAFIIPYKEESAFLAESKNNQLLPFRITRIRGRQESDLKRSMIQLSREVRQVDHQELIIEKKRHEYTDDYIKLVKDFYLNM